jgi:hypothetical protein
MSDAMPVRDAARLEAASSYDEDLTQTTKERLAYYEALEEEAKERRLGRPS